jgi:hypothetical protein
MKKLDTSAININSWMPLLANNPAGLAGIDFLQQAYIECLRALAGFLVADSTKVTIMYGCGITSWTSSETTTTLETNAGWVFYNGELFYVLAYTSLHPFTYPNADVCVNVNINTTVYSNCDPTTFSDGAVKSVHQQRQLEFAASPTANAGNVPDFTTWLTIATNSSATAATTAVLNAWLTSTYNVFITNYNAWLNALMPPPILVGTDGTTPVFQNGWANSHGVSGVGTPSPLAFYKLADRVYIWGEVTHAAVNSSVIFTLPNGYLPLASEELFHVPDTTLLTPTSAAYTQPTAGYNIWITSDGTVNFLGAPTEAFSISLSGINFKAAPPELEE